MVYTVVQWAPGTSAFNRCAAWSPIRDSRSSAATSTIRRRRARISASWPGSPRWVCRRRASIDDISRIDADCVVYNALGDSGDAAQCVEDVCGFSRRAPTLSRRRSARTFIRRHEFGGAERLSKACSPGRRPSTAPVSIRVSPSTRYRSRCHRGAPHRSVARGGARRHVGVHLEVDLSGLIGMGMRPDDLGIDGVSDGSCAGARTSPVCSC